MAAAIPAMGVVGGVISGMGALKKGQMTANSLQAQAGLERVQAGEARQAGEFNAFRSQLQATQSLGRTTAAYGASGVSSDSTSAQAVLMAGAQNAELDRQNIIHGADIKATTYANQASLESFGANSALHGSYFSALSSVLGGSSQELGNLVGGGSGIDSPDRSSVLSSKETDILQKDLESMGPVKLGQEGEGNLSVP